MEKELYHYGVVGMKWGVIKSKYINKDGTLTDKGKVKNTKAINRSIFWIDTERPVKLYSALRKKRRLINEKRKYIRFC